MDSGPTRPGRKAASPPAPESLGHFQVQGVLGEGGSGTVYEAAWGHRRVALKVLRHELLTTTREQDRFLTEAALLQAVDHPGVVKVLGSGTLPDGRPYLAMEHLDGESLAARIARGPIPLAEALALFAQLSSAVQALHLRGLIHRDIKPENVILTGQYAVLLDFGIAKAENAPASTITQEGSIRGTPAYMAPERFFGAAASIATDVYELAVLFYAMVTGRLPWDNVADPSARLNPPRPSQLGLALPASVEGTLLQALSTRAETRPASVAELAARMTDAAGVDPSRMTADLPPPMPMPLVTPPAPAPRRSRTNRLLAIGAGVALSGAIVVAVVLATRGETPQAAPAPAPAPAPPAATPVTLIEPPPLWNSSPIGDGWLDEVVRLHPADSVGLMGISVARLRESKLVAAILDEEKDGAPGKYLAMLDAACGFPVLDSIEGVLFGAANDVDIELDASFRGTFTRAQVEKCLTGILAEGDADSAPVTRRGPVSRIQSGKRTLWMVWPDPHTVFITSRAGIDEAWMEERVRGAKSVRDTKPVFSLLDEVDTGAGIWLVAAPTRAGASPIPGTEPPRAIYASLLVTNEMKVHAGLRFEKPEEAREMALALATQLEAFKREPLAAMWLKDAGFGVRESDAIFTATMDHTMALITLRGLVEQLSK